MSADLSLTEQFESIRGEYAQVLERLTGAYESDPEKRRDLLQEIHLQLWLSLRRFEGRCSLRTWVYRVAHNAATAYVSREKNFRSRLYTLEEIDAPSAQAPIDQIADGRIILDRLAALIQSLKPIDRQIMVCYLEDLDASAIGEITGLSAENVAMKIHRIKQVLATRFHKGANHGS